MQNERPPASKDPFERKRTAYFSSLALSLKDAFKAHKEFGLLDRMEGERDWGNVSKHCLVEAARASAFAEKLKLSEETKQKLVMAAALHDSYKKQEMEALKKRGPTLSTIEAVAEESHAALEEHGFDPEVIELAGSVGATKDVFDEMDRIFARADALSERDIAYLVAHYIDDYTVNEEWAKPVDPETGHNDLDRRMEKNEDNEKYATLNEEGKALFGRSLYETQREYGHEAEALLAKLVEERSGIRVTPSELPEFIDQEIRAKIDSQSAAS